MTRTELFLQGYMTKTAAPGLRDILRLGRSLLGMAEQPEVASILGKGARTIASAVERAQGKADIAENLARAAGKPKGAREVISRAGTKEKAIKAMPGPKKADSMADWYRNHELPRKVTTVAKKQPTAKKPVDPIKALRTAKPIDEGLDNTPIQDLSDEEKAAVYANRVKKIKDLTKGLRTPKAVTGAVVHSPIQEVYATPINAPAEFVQRQLPGRIDPVRALLTERPEHVRSQLPGRIDPVRALLTERPEAPSDVASGSRLQSLVQWLKNHPRSTTFGGGMVGGTAVTAGVNALNQED